MDKKITWPDGSNIAVALTFDFGAEFFRLSRSTAKGKKLGFGDCSRGQYGPHEGLARVLTMLKQRNLKATFFVPTMVLEAYPECIKAIVDEGHELACSGERAEFEIPTDRAAEEKKLSKAEALILAASGCRPVGFRSKEVQNWTMDLLKERGYLYSSTLHDCDWSYVHKNGLVELPTDVIADDSTYWFFTFQDPINRSMYTNSHVMDDWKAEFDALLEEKDKILVFTLHPQLCGRSSRIQTLGRLLDYFISQHAWMPTCSELAAYTATHTKEVVR